MKYQKKGQETSPERVTEEIWAVQAVVVRRSGRMFTPPTDVIELPDKLVILVEIAGMKTNDFQITLFNRNLIVTGYRERPQLDNPAYHQVEIGFGEFRVEVRLQWPVQQEQVSATYGEGFLQIELPRLAPTQIHIADVSTEGQE